MTEAAPDRGGGRGVLGGRETRDHVRCCLSERTSEEEGAEELLFVCGWRRAAGEMPPERSKLGLFRRWLMPCGG
jgi:hypothetical protein